MKVVFQSSKYFSNIRTTLVHFVLLPIFQICFLLLMLDFYTGDYSVELTTASLVMSGVSLAISMVTGLFIGDIRRGIDRYVLVNSHFSMYYWATKVLVVFISAMLVVLINSILFSLFGLVDFIKLIWMSPILIIFGIVIGLTGSFLSWRNSNPYLYSNIFNSFIMILSGAVISFEKYPLFLKEATYIFPFARVLNNIHQQHASIAIDFFVFLIWVVIMVIIYKIQKLKISMNKHYGGF